MLPHLPGALEVLLVDGDGYLLFGAFSIAVRLHGLIINLYLVDKLGLFKVDVFQVKGEVRFRAIMGCTLGPDTLRLLPTTLNAFLLIAHQGLIFLVTW